MPSARRWIVSTVVVAALWGGGLFFLANRHSSIPNWDGRYQFDVPPDEARRAIEALRFSPSTLARLGVTVARPRLEQVGDRATALVVPATQHNGEVRFAFDLEPLEGGAKTTVNLMVSIGDLPELDLGSDRLINRATLAERADDALSYYADEVAGRVPKKGASLRFGRVFDQAGLLGNPIARTKAARLSREEGRLDPLFGVTPRAGDEPDFDESANYPADPHPGEW